MFKDLYWINSAVRLIFDNCWLVGLFVRLMEQEMCGRVYAKLVNDEFDRRMRKFLRKWARKHEDKTLLRFDQQLKEYVARDALRDFFLHTKHPMQRLLKHDFIGAHLARSVDGVFFDTESGDPLLARWEQRIYNLARRMDSEAVHVPFRSVHPNKQTETGDAAEICTYPPESELIRYNSGNHFSSRPANEHVFRENSKRCVARSEGNLQVLFKRGYLEDRLQEVKELMALRHEAAEDALQFFVIYSRHSAQEGHYGVSLVIMNPRNPDFPVRVMVCDTLLKQLPQHPRWWHHFIAEYTQIFGYAVAEIIEDLSHPLQKVNIKGDEPYRHDWDCPYYAASMADALAELVKTKPQMLLQGSIAEIHEAMKVLMPDYYQADQTIKDRPGIRYANRLKRWESGRQMITDLLPGISRKASRQWNGC